MTKRKSERAYALYRESFWLDYRDVAKTIGETEQETRLAIEQVKNQKIYGTPTNYQGKWAQVHSSPAN